MSYREAQRRVQRLRKLLSEAEIEAAIALAEIGTTKPRKGSA